MWRAVLEDQAGGLVHRADFGHHSGDSSRRICEYSIVHTGIAHPFFLDKIRHGKLDRFIELDPCSRFVANCWLVPSKVGSTRFLQLVPR